MGWLFSRVVRVVGEQSVENWVNDDSIFLPGVWLTAHCAMLQSPSYRLTFFSPNVLVIAHVIPLQLLQLPSSQSIIAGMRCVAVSTLSCPRKRSITLVKFVTCAESAYYVTTMCVMWSCGRGLQSQLWYRVGELISPRSDWRLIRPVRQE